MKTTHKFPTRIDLPEKTREKMIFLLNQELADLLDLYSQTKQAHWNVKGEEFFQLHELFDKLAEELENYADTVAERATALGGIALGTIRMATARSSLPEYPSNVFGCLPTVQALAERYAKLAASSRKAIDTAAHETDMGTADLFTEVSRGLDKALWFLEAHLRSA